MDYNEQAQQWLDATGSTLVIKRVPDFMQKAPLWDGPHGYQYLAVLRRNDKEYRIDFWDSVANKEKERNHCTYRRIHPTQYDVLACLDTYIDESVSLGDFMSDYGYDVKHVDHAQKALAQLQAQSRTLRGMYSEAELEALNEIR